MIDTSLLASSDLLDLFVRYNEAVWPAHVVPYIAGIVTVVVIVTRDGRLADLTTSGLLAAMWLWLGVVFLGMYATDLSPGLSTFYAITFVVQSALFVRAGIVRRDLRYEASGGPVAALGWFLVGYGMVIYPVVGFVLGHGYPEAPLFGMAPCPTTIATFGFLLVARRPVPRHLFGVPLMWAVLAPPAAMSQGIREDVALLVLGVIAAAIGFAPKTMGHARARLQANT